MGEILSGYGNSLSQVGRYDEAQKNLTEAMSLAKELQNKTLIAQILNFQGDTFLTIAATLSRPRTCSRRRLPQVSSDVEKDVVLLSRYNAAKCLVEQKRYQAAIAPLKAVTAEGRCGRTKKYFDRGDAVVWPKRSSTCGSILRRRRNSRRRWQPAKSWACRFCRPEASICSGEPRAFRNGDCGSATALRVPANDSSGRDSPGIRQRCDPEAARYWRQSRRNPPRKAKIDIVMREAESLPARLATFLRYHGIVKVVVTRRKQKVEALR